MLINMAKSHAFICINIMPVGRVQDIHLVIKLVPNVAEKVLSHCLITDPLLEHTD